MKRWLSTCGAAVCLFGGLSGANAAQPELSIEKASEGLDLKLTLNGHIYLTAPAEGLWSIAHHVDDTQPIEWLSAKPDSLSTNGPWTIYQGRLEMADGQWLLRDACQPELNRVRCVRRMEWQGQTTLKDVVLSVRWQLPQREASAFQPGLLYYGNPAGKKNSLVRSAHMVAEPGEFTLFEEHRFSMPLTSLEWQQEGKFYGAALHTQPSPVPHANLEDQWWSLGVEYYESHTELKALSGPIGYNKQRGVTKFKQQESAPYTGATMTVKPGAIIEKTYFLEAYPVLGEGDGFRQPLHTSMDIFKPYHVEDFPTIDSIIDSKLRATQKRYFEGEAFAGFNMFDHKFREWIVMGWAGQSDAPGYSFLPLSKKLNRRDLAAQAQKSMDFLSQAPFVEEGFNLRYDPKKKHWSHHDHISQGQALFMFAKAIEQGRPMTSIDTTKWEAFFVKAASFHANRILSDEWYPASTAEGFHVAPLVIGYRLFGEERFKQAAIKAAEHYGQRHLSMREPYWGGTLDAKGEDKEGAWAALQAFMAAYDMTGEQKYLDWALHAGDAVISYTVVWDMPMPAGRLADRGFKSRGWTSVSPQNQHLDVYGVLTTPWIYRLGELTKNENLKRLAIVMFRSCGQLIDPFDEHGEQIQQTNFVQSRHNLKVAGKEAKPADFRGGYSEEWTVLWISTHFLTAYALFDEMGVELQ